MENESLFQPEYFVTQSDFPQTATILPPGSRIHVISADYFSTESTTGKASPLLVWSQVSKILLPYESQETSTYSNGIPIIREGTTSSFSVGFPLNGTNLSVGQQILIESIRSYSEGGTNAFAVVSSTNTAFLLALQHNNVQVYVIGPGSTGRPKNQV